MPTDKHRESIKRTPEQFGVFFILSEYQFFRKYFTTFSQIYLTFGNVALYLQRQNEDKMSDEEKRLNNLLSNMGDMFSPPDGFFISAIIGTGIVVVAFIVVIVIALISCPCHSF